VNRILKPGGALIVANLDVLALSMPLRLVLLPRTLAYSAIGYHRALPRVTQDRLLDEAKLRRRLEEAGFCVAESELIRDRSVPWNCPVDYVKAIKEPTGGRTGSVERDVIARVRPGRA
jgi:hypothetical protein